MINYFPVSFKSTILRTYFSLRSRAVERFRRHPAATQREQLERLLRECAHTAFGQRYGFGGIRTPEAFAQRVERFDYDTFRPYIDRMLAGERDVTAPGRVRWFARSSGTTSDRSKYLPVTDASLRRCHTRGLRDVATFYVGQYPSTRVFEGKTLTLGGSCSAHDGVVAGDLSALLVERTPFWSGWFRAPRRATALLSDFDEKVERICRECASEPITAFAGVPSWNLALMRRMVECTGRRNLCEVWPRLELFAHGGVGFEPYRAAFRELIPSDGMHYMETYNASEGFFAIADDASRDDMLLMLDYGTYYEFRDGDEVVPLEGVRCGGRYALLISSCNGLWRYEPGDVVEFTATDPYRIRVAGRTRQFINAFGEELVMENAERAVTAAAAAAGAVVAEYTAAPRYMTLRERGAHEWIVEFHRAPERYETFAGALDRELMRLNSDYEAKRRSTMAPPVLHVVPAGTFDRWMLRRRKNKVPRLSNDRRVLEDVLATMVPRGEAAGVRTATE